MTELGLTNTSDSTSLSYSLASQQQTVTVHLGGSPLVSSLLGATSVHRILEIPPHSKWSPGAHWHEDYTEHIRVLKGRAKVWINGACREVAAGGEATFHLFDIHDFCRADVDGDEELLIEEWVDNENGEKEIFFHNVFSIVKDTEKFGGLLWAFLRVFYVFSYRDNYVAFLPATSPFWTQRITTATVFGTIKAIGKVSGWKTWYRAYTPPALESLADTPSKGKKII